MVRYVVALAALVAAAGCPSKATCPTGAVASGAVADDDVAAVLRTIESWRQAYEARSLYMLHPLYDHGESVAVVTQGVAIVGWDAVRTELTDRLGRARDIRLRLTDITVSPTGAAAVATGALSREITEGSTSVADTGTLTLVLGRAGDGWVIVAEHFSFRPR
jgi:ketosteroid isomerase-like protein